MWYRWVIVLIYVGIIYLTIPYTTALWITASQKLGLKFSTMAFYPIVLTGSTVLLYGVIRRTLNLWRLVGLAGCGVVYYSLYGTIFQTPAEKIHLIEYGLLSFGLFWAAEQIVDRVQWPVPRRIVVTLLLAFMFGTWDETIQYYVPTRTYDLRDVWINWLSSGLGFVVCLLVRKDESKTIALSGAP